jgi:pSer/pThr/pTyr-binding forkhead associated (FHA) protein
MCPPSRRISREHARVERRGRRAIPAGLGSTNTTFLNDERLLAPVELRDGDRVEAGDAVLTSWRATPSTDAWTTIAPGRSRCPSALQRGHRESPMALAATPTGTTLGGCRCDER